MPNIYYEEKVTQFSTGVVDESGGLKTNPRQRSPLANVARFRIEAGTIETIDIWADFANPGVGAVQRFTVRVNGVDQYPASGDQLDLAGTSHASKVGQSIDVSDGDIVAIDLTAVSGDGVIAPIYFRIGLNSAAIPIVVNLDDLDDVDASSPSDGDALVYDTGSSLWVPAAPSGGASALDDLSDVDLTTTPPSDGDTLVYDSGSSLWVPGAPSGGGGSTIELYSPDIPYATPSAFDDEFDAGSLDAKWTALNGSYLPTLTWDVASAMKLTTTSEGKMNGYYQAGISGNDFFAMKVSPGRVWNGSTGGISLVVVPNFGAGDWMYRAMKYSPYSADISSKLWSNTVTVNSNGNLSSTAVATNKVTAPTCYLGVRINSASRTVVWYFSIDGLSFIDLTYDYYTYSPGHYPGGIGFFVDETPSGGHYIHWFRKLQGTRFGGGFQVAV